MEGSESSINRISRNIWTVWGYLTGAVGRYLRPESTNTEEHVKQEEAVPPVTLNKSYRELKEDEDVQETKAGIQSEKPQSAIKVRAAAVQWEKVHSGKSGTSKHPSTGIVWDTALQGGRLEDVDKKTQEQKGQTLDNNNEAVQTKSDDFVENVDLVGKVSSKDSGVSRCLDNVGSETKDLVEREHTENEKEAMQKEHAEQEVVNVMEQTEDQDDKNHEQENQEMTGDEDGARTSQKEDDHLSQLTCSTREREDLSNEVIKVNEKCMEETAENNDDPTKPRMEVIGVNNEETEKGIVGRVKDEQNKVNQRELMDSEVVEPKSDEIEFIQELVEADSRLLDKCMASLMLNEELHEPISYSFESGPPERVTVSVVNEETKRQTVNDGQQTAGLQLSELDSGSKSAHKLDMFESKLNKAQHEHTELIVVRHDLVEEPVIGQVKNEEMYSKEAEPISQSIENKAALTPERELTGTIEVTEQETVATAKDRQSAVGQVLNEGSEDELDVSESNVVEAQYELTEGKKYNKHESLDRMGQVRSSEMHKNESESLCKFTESKSALTSEKHLIDDIETAATANDRHPEMGQFKGSEISEKLDIQKPNLVEFQNEQTEENVDTKYESLEELMTGQNENAEISENESEPLCKDVENKAALTSEREPIDTIEEFEMLATDGKQEEGKKLSECGVETEYESLEDFVTGQMKNVEICENEPVDESALTSERYPVNSKETNQGAESMGKDLKQETGQQLSQSKAVETNDVHEIKLDEKHNEEVTENEAIITPKREVTDVNNEDIKHEIVGMVKDEQCEISPQLNESKAAEMIDVFESKLNEAQLVEPERRQLEELVIGQLENGGIFEKEKEPSTQSTDNKAALAPKWELIETIDVTEQETAKGKLDIQESHLIQSQSKLAEGIVETKLEETVDTVEVTEPESLATDGPHEVDQQLSEFKVSEIADEMDVRHLNLVDVQCELAEEKETVPLEDFVTGQMENAEICEEKPDLISSGCLMKGACRHESGDSALSLVIMETGHLELHKEDVEAGNTTRQEVVLLDHSLCKIIGPEVVIKQDNECVAAGPGDQSETTKKFQQEIRVVVATDDVTKWAELERNLQPTAKEEFPLQETLVQCTFEQGSLQKMSSEENTNELVLLDEPFSERETKKASHAKQDEEVIEVPRPFPQQQDEMQAIATREELKTELSVEKTKDILTEQKKEVLERHIKLPAVGNCATTVARCQQAESKTEGQTCLTITETLEKSMDAEEPAPNGENEHSEQIVHQDLPERPSTVSETLSNPQKGAEELKELFELERDPESKGESNDESEIGLPDKIKTTSLGKTEMKSSLVKGSEQSLLSKEETGCLEAEMVETKEEVTLEGNDADLQTHDELSFDFLENKMDLKVDGKVTVEAVDEMSQNASGEHAENIEGETVVDRNEVLQGRSRSELKRVSGKMARDEEDKAPVAKGWAAPELLLKQVSSLDCTVQKSKIAVKNRFVRPPKNPRTLINMASVEPLAASRPSQPSPLGKGQGEGLAVKPPGIIGFKLPGLGAGLPVLRKTEAGRKMRDGGDAESTDTKSTDTKSTDTQKSDTPTDSKEEKERPASKPKWTPPRHPGMGNPLMMSELKSKLKKTGKD